MEYKQNHVYFYFYSIIRNVDMISVSKEEPQGSQNFHIWKTETGEQVQHLIQKRMMDW